MRQVRWHNRHNKILLAYEQSSPIRFSHTNPKVQLTTSHNDGSSITIEKVGPDDEGCYRCVCRKERRASASPVSLVFTELQINVPR